MESIFGGPRRPLCGAAVARLCRPWARPRGANRAGRLHRILYAERIRKRGWLGIPYTALKLRTAHVDERRWRLLRGRPFSVHALMCAEFLRND